MGREESDPDEKEVERRLLPPSPLSRGFLFPSHFLCLKSTNSGWRAAMIFLISLVVNSRPPPWIPGKNAC
jgi:hypothetical protein